ncbi:MAG TPA: acyl-CoA dehydratase activase-related protein, partial [Spirochaetota bacterium]|nr:acyl-CoA dehydratase activase-related protein [Spirochaetota bacterium]
GSGRKLVKEVFKADIDINEITTHAKAATFLDKEVDTIIEIGGQDSKYTLLHNGNVVNATMNYVCAAGTGSFIEEQAKRLSISLDDISRLAIGRAAPFTSDRCAVYMERDLNIFLSEGFTKEEIITSVLYSVRDNYLSKVVAKSPIGKRIFFQGATARNQALVSVFETGLGKEIFVSKYCHLTGALGAALYAKELGLQKSGFRFSDFNFTKEIEICSLCHNNCELSVYSIDNVKTCWGLKCGREYSSNKAKAMSKNSELSKRYKEIFEVKNEIQKNKKIGYPATIELMEFYPLFKDFFEKLGFEFVLEHCDRNKIERGEKLINSDFCAPVIALHGIVEAISKKTDFIFLPSIINEKNLIDEQKSEEEKYIDKFTDSFFCYYSQYAPVIIDKLTTLNLEDKLLTPKIKFNNVDIKKSASNIAFSLSEKLEIPNEVLIKKFLESYENWSNNKTKWKNLGKSIMQKEGKKIMFIGRPYSFLDNYLNNGIPKKFEDTGFPILYQDMIESEIEKNYSQKFIDRMHWFFGQEILLASEFVAKSDDVYPVFLTYFRCSPDSYLLTYFKDIMHKADKPYLVVQLDEHQSDVGYQTRIEAFTDTVKNHTKKDKTELPPKKNFTYDKISNDLTVLIPYISPVISELQRSAFESYGYKSILLPLEEKMFNEGFKYCSGGECLPNVSIIGSIVSTMKTLQLEQNKTIVYMPTACLSCNFNQYGILIKTALESAGFPDIKISNANTLRQLEELPKELNVNLTEANILGSILYKLLFRVRPYEKNKGETNEIFNKSFELIKENLKSKKSLMETARTIKDFFEKIERLDSNRKPKVAILGDMYAKYNHVLNNDIYDLIESLGGEVVIPSFTDTAAHIFHFDIKENNLEPKYLRGLSIFEKRYERIFESLIGDNFEPDMEECFKYMEEYGIKHYIVGETSLNLGRMLYYAKKNLVSAAVHLNPVFCCPGVVTSSIFRKIRKDFEIPIIDIFYDGSNKPNNIIIPQLYFLADLQNRS